jgi:hypothetical protein
MSPRRQDPFHSEWEQGVEASDSTSALASSSWLGRSLPLRWMAYCEKECAAEGFTLKGCMWLADLKLDWEGRLYDAGGRYAITHCCCDYPVLSKEETQAARDQWDQIRESFREDWSKKFGDWPLERGKSWPGHHIRDLKHGGDPVDPNNILPTPPTIHDVLNKEYPRCYDGLPPWNTVGPDLPYSDE